MKNPKPVPLSSDNHSKVLLVEDDELLGPLYTFLLEKEKIIVRVCSTAADVFTILQSEKFNLILLDMMLPNISGLELLPQLHKIVPETTILMLSNLHQPELQQQALERGATAYLVKSELTPDDFINEVNKHICEKSTGVA